MTTSDSTAAETTPETAAETALHRHRISTGFARFYAPLAVMTFALTFFPYYEPDPEAAAAYGSLWQEVARTGHSYDVIAVAAFLAVVALLILAGLEKLDVVGLIIAAALALSIGSLLWASPGFSEPPTLSAAGILDITICLLGAGLLACHAICLLVLTRSGKRRAAA